jgi:hypothetical protein
MLIRFAIYKALEGATKDCTNAYKKGKRSFEILEKLDGNALQANLPSFVRMIRILKEKLPSQGHLGG